MEIAKDDYHESKDMGAGLERDKGFRNECPRTHPSLITYHLPRRSTRTFLSSHAKHQPQHQPKPTAPAPNPLCNMNAYASIEKSPRLVKPRNNAAPGERCPSQTSYPPLPAPRSVRFQKRRQQRRRQKRVKEKQGYCSTADDPCGSWNQQTKATDKVGILLPKR